MLSLSLKVPQGLYVAFECSGGEATREEFESLLLEEEERIQKCNIVMGHLN